MISTEHLFQNLFDQISKSIDGVLGFCGAGDPTPGKSWFGGRLVGSKKRKKHKEEKDEVAQQDL